MTETLSFYPHVDSVNPLITLTFESGEYGWWTPDLGPLTLAILMAPVWDLMAGALR